MSKVADVLHLLETKVGRANLKIKGAMLTEIRHWHNACVDRVTGLYWLFNTHEAVTELSGNIHDRL
jgi:hypothetical protein